MEENNAQRSPVSGHFATFCLTLITVETMSSFSTSTHAFKKEDEFQNVGGARQHISTVSE